MKRPKPKDVVTEIRCPACEGTGFSKVTQPVQPGRKIYPPPCKQCLGKGRIESPRPWRRWCRIHSFRPRTARALDCGCGRTIGEFNVARMP